MTPEREAQLLEKLASRDAEIARLRIENQLLHQRIDLILRQLFDKKSESLDPLRLPLPLDPEVAKKASAADPAGPGPAAETPVSKKRGPRKPRDHSHLEVRETVLVSEEAKADPAAYRELDRIVTERFDYQPSRIFIERTVRVVHIAKADPAAAPVKPSAPPSLGLGATPRLIAHVLASKYCHHRPHYRTAGIFEERHGVHIPRNTLCHWDKVAADALEPLYKLLHHGLLQSNYLQADETPVPYLHPGKGKTATGYLWTIHAPRNGIKGDMLFQWHPSRRASCLDDLLENYQGTLQTDAYGAYDSWISARDRIILAACWTHARRKFHEAFKAGQSLAAGPLAAIQRIYQTESAARKNRASPEERRQLRQQYAAPVLQILKPDLVALRQRPEVLPKSPLGKAIDHTLTLWDRLNLYLEDGNLEIDNNLIENGIRPTAIGKKNWLFVGGETTGRRAAIIYTMVECARRHGHSPEAWLTDVLTRLPAMTNQDDLGALLPSRWQPAASPAVEANPAATA